MVEPVIENTLDITWADDVLNNRGTKMGEKSSAICGTFFFNKAITSNIQDENHLQYFVLTSQLVRNWFLRKV